MLYPAELPGRARHYSLKGSFRSRAFAWAALALIWPALADAQTCPRPEQNVGALVKIHPRLELEIEDGRRLRLIHLAPFEASPRGAARMAQAQMAVQEWTASQFLALPQRLPLADRWGRILTPVFLATGEDLGLRLVAQGFVRVAPAHSDPCLAPLLEAEQRARNAKLGLWADSYYAVLAATSPTALAAHAGEFVIVEGVVQRMGQTSARIYLDLGAARERNLSVTMSRQNMKVFAAAGGVPDQWIGKTIRVRGVLDFGERPQIEIYTPAAVDVIGPKL